MPDKRSGPPKRATRQSPPTATTHKGRRGDGIALVTAPGKGNANHWTRKRTTWPGLLDRLAKPAQERHCGGYVAGTFHDTEDDHNGRLAAPDTGLHRKAHAVDTRTLVTLDADKAELDLPDLLREAMPGTAWAMHSTASHTLDDPRFRVLVPPSRPMQPHEYRAVARVLMRRIGIAQFDTTCDQPERFMYWPSAPNGGYVLLVEDGEPLDVDAVLAEADPEDYDARQELDADEPVGEATAAERGRAAGLLAHAAQEVEALRMPNGERAAGRNHAVNAWMTPLYGVVKFGALERGPVDEALWDAAQAAPGDHPYDRAEFNATRRSAMRAAVPQRPHGGPEDDFSQPLVHDLSHRRMVPGGSFILDAPEGVPAVWGRGNAVVWARGEAFTLAGPPGVGKTTLAGQVVRALMVGGDVLGMPVAPTETRVLYLAMDRPQQIARSLRRTLGDLPRDVLDERLVVWPGPPLQDVAKHPDTLLELAQEAGADVLIVDSIKDAAIGLSDDDTGAGYNRARQTALAAGVEVMELHHMTKRGENGSKPTTLMDLYGSVWIGAGSGSVVLLWGQPGETAVHWTHLKQPAEPVGPFTVLHEHGSGTSALLDAAPDDLLDALIRSGEAGLTHKQAATVMTGNPKPDAAAVQRAKRRLEHMVEDGEALVAVAGSKATRTATVYIAAPEDVDDGV